MQSRNITDQQCAPFHVRVQVPSRACWGWRVPRWLADLADPRSPWMFKRSPLLSDLSPFPISHPRLEVISLPRSQDGNLVPRYPCNLNAAAALRFAPSQRAHSVLFQSQCSRPCSSLLPIPFWLHSHPGQSPIVDHHHHPPDHRLTVRQVLLLSCHSFLPISRSLLFLPC